MPTSSYSSTRIGNFAYDPSTNAVSEILDAKATYMHQKGTMHTKSTIGMKHISGSGHELATPVFIDRRHIAERHSLTRRPLNIIR